jgi:predicted nucleic acid-binding protein
MPEGKAFLDTNIVLYALSKDEDRKELVADLLKGTSNNPYFRSTF